MSLRSSNRCPVCGYDLGFPPWTGDSASDEICPSCGIQFGYDDAAGGQPEMRTHVYEEWRRKWINSGMKWSSVGQPPPPLWDPREQLRGIEAYRPN